MNRAPQTKGPVLDRALVWSTLKPAPCLAVPGRDERACHAWREYSEIAVLANSDLVDGCPAGGRASVFLLAGSSIHYLKEVGS